jgi:hypothetical protein
MINQSADQCVPGSPTIAGPKTPIETEAGDLIYILGARGLLCTKAGVEAVKDVGKGSRQ